MTIKYIQYFGQRRTGSSWLSRVLRNSCQVEVGEKFGLKHDKDCNFAAGNVDETLFLFINRDIYMWLDALHKNPWGIEEYRGLSLSEFIRSPWYNKIPDDVKRWYPECKLGPGTEIKDYSGGLLIPGRFDTPIHMRNAKVDAWTDVKNSVPHAEDISYVECIGDLRGYLGKLFNKYDIGYNINAAEGIVSGEKKEYFLTRKYLDKYSTADLDFIRDNCDVHIEKRIGFVL